MKNILSFLVVTLLLVSSSCSKQDTTRPVDDKWLVPSNLVRDGGPGKDGIPSVDNPKFITVSEVDFLQNADLVVGIISNGETKAYPHPILDWHEIVNDEIDGHEFALTYCPLTGTAFAWDRMLDGSLTSFGVSGKLYNNNLIPYDRSTDSYWSQISLTCINGEKIGTKIETIPLVETTWATWKSMYPDSKILSDDTGFNRNYDNYPYGDYIINNNNIIFPLTTTDTRLLSKERVFAIISDGDDKAYRLNSFETPKAIYDNISGDEVIVVGSKQANFITSFINDGLVDLSIDFSNLPIIGEDANGNVLDVDGNIVSGPKAGQQLQQPVSSMGYWFSFGAFYPGIEIYE